MRNSNDAATRAARAKCARGVVIPLCECTPEVGVVRAAVFVARLVRLQKGAEGGGRGFCDGDNGA